MAKIVKGPKGASPGATGALHVVSEASQECGLPPVAARPPVVYRHLFERGVDQSILFDHAQVKGRCPRVNDNTVTRVPVPAWDPRARGPKRKAALAKRAHARAANRAVAEGVNKFIREANRVALTEFRAMVRRRKAARFAQSKDSDVRKVERLPRYNGPNRPAFVARPPPPAPPKLGARHGGKRQAPPPLEVYQRKAY